MRHKMYRLAAACLLLAVCKLTGTALAIPADRELPTTWKIQPAVNPATPPKNADWATLAPLGESTSDERPSNEWRKAKLNDVPDSWKNMDRKKVHELWYEQDIDIPADAQGCRVVLYFWRIEGDAVVFVNGQRVSELLRPGGEVEVTRFAKAGQANTIRVYVTRNYTGISRDYAHDPLRYAARGGADTPSAWGMGISGPVRVIYRPAPAGISDVFAIPSWRKKQLTLSTEIDALKATDNVQLQAVVRDQDGREVLNFASKPLSVPAGKSQQMLTTPWENPTTWELERGYLYTAEVSLVSGGKVLQTFNPIKFGFRELWTEGKEIMMNGHPIRLRLSALHGSLAEGVSFLHMIGYNAFQMQPHENNWWREWSETPMLNERLLDYLDQNGYAATTLAPAITRLRQVLLKDPQCTADYQREVEHWVRKYRNHPSIFYWAVGMNFFNPKEAIHPAGLGQRETGPKLQQTEVIEAGGAMIKKIDPTRMTYSHADGNNSDLATGNIYLNFAPLQEREDWPLAWYEKGNMPISAVEFGQPFTANFWKQKKFLMTEYLSMYFGESAYERESLEGLQKTLDYGVATSGFGSAWKMDMNQYPVYWDFQSLFVRNTNRAWRSWGVNGGYMNWIQDVAYGNPPGYVINKSNSMYMRYRLVDKPVTERPDWASPNFDIHQQANKTLLAYIGGAPMFTDKTHAFYSEEKILKQIVAVWDGYDNRTLDAQWRFVTADGKNVIAGGEETLALTPGGILKKPITMAAPRVSARTETKLELTVRDGKNVVATDSFDVQIFPQPEKLNLNARVALYDPKGLSAPELKAIGVNPVAWKPGDSTQNIDLLIIGRDAWNTGDALGYSPADIARGLRVLMLEQPFRTWEALGFKTIETMPRYVFMRDKNSPLFAGIVPEDLINWRGSPDILPECQFARSYDVVHAPKWTNRHAVASVVMQIPEAAGYTPLMQCEFDLNYSPLIESRFGKGAVWYSSLDFTRRTGVDPAATIILRNLLTLALAPLESARTTMYAGGPAGEAFCTAMNIATAKASLDQPEQSLLIIGEGQTGLNRSQIDAYLSSGGRVVWLNQDAKALSAMGLQTHPDAIWRTKADNTPALRSIGQNLLRWRDELKADVFDASSQGTVLAGGLMLVRSSGAAGRELFVQVDPQQFVTRYAKEQDRLDGVQLSVLHGRQLVAQLITNMGAGVSPQGIARMTTIKAGIAYEWLGGWNILGPFIPPAEKPLDYVQKPWAGEQSAITGDTNPNLTYRTPEGKELDWRTVAVANEDGYVDLGRLLKRNADVAAYATRVFHSDEARVAVMRMGFDYWAQVWVNGELVYRTTKPSGSPKPNRYSVKINLKKGENIITLKMVSGGKGFGFWNNISKPGFDVNQAEQEVSRNVMYQPLIVNFDPYAFAYW